MTLLEALVALAIVAMAMTGLSDALYSTGHAARRTAFEIRAAIDAQSLIAELAVAPSLDGFAKQGVFADGLAWTMAVAPLDPNPQGPPGLVTGEIVKVAISSESGGSPLEFRTILTEAAR